MNASDKKYMSLALKLAGRGISRVEPNPAVGCVVVNDGKVIGQGWHSKFGGPHAEINALADCSKNGFSPEDATMYVTLEPCCHKGKTGPCSEAIMQAGISRVVIATVDPSEHANETGIRQLRDSGIKVDVGICEDEAKLLNAPFLKFASSHQPWVILKWAQSTDGWLGWKGDESERKWISNEKSRKDAHKLRRRVQGILVGINTVLKDNPLLTARPSLGRKALKIVLDSNLKIPIDSQLVKNSKKTPVLIITDKKTVESKPDLVEKLESKGVEVIDCPVEKDGLNLKHVIDELTKRDVQQLLVEGGPRVLSSFLKENLADEICVYTSPLILGKEGEAGISTAMADMVKKLELKNIQIIQFDGDVCIKGLT